MKARNPSVRRMVDHGGAPTLSFFTAKQCLTKLPESPVRCEYIPCVATSDGAVHLPNSVTLVKPQHLPVRRMVDHGGALTLSFFTAKQCLLEPPVFWVRCDFIPCVARHDRCSVPRQFGQAREAAPPACAARWLIAAVHFTVSFITAKQCLRNYPNPGLDANTFRVSPHRMGQCASPIRSRCVKPQHLPVRRMVDHGGALTLSFFTAKQCLPKLPESRVRCEYIPCVATPDGAVHLPNSVTLVKPQHLPVRRMVDHGGALTLSFFTAKQCLLEPPVFWVRCDFIPCVARHDRCSVPRQFGQAREAAPPACAAMVDRGGALHCSVYHSEAMPRNYPNPGLDARVISVCRHTGWGSAPPQFGHTREAATPACATDG